MEKFLALKPEKQTAILNAALECFGRYGYAKASVRDIAAAAHISKASVFQYFGTKKTLYLYLLRYSGQVMTDAFDRAALDAEQDLFYRIFSAAAMKVAALKQHPALTQFLVSAWNETAAEVRDDLAALFAHGDAYRSELVLRPADARKFRSPEDARAVLQILVLMAEGAAARCRDLDPAQIDGIMDELKTAMTVLRRNFYKEEFLQ